MLQLTRQNAENLKSQTVISNSEVGVSLIALYGRWQ
jgi:hypothetical protein